ncbi:uncharacterized protein LOC141631378 [Silene latifolia]|uniref:uncharacterized protein LOC141631378 n=1 Tax=Silene latifolia TaxID=37657 RepID=UPI003D781806
MLRVWSPQGKVVGSVVDARQRIFIFRFEDVRDKGKVLDGQPWHFDKYVWCFNEPNAEGNLMETPLYYMPLWTRIYDLPIKGRTNEDNVRRLGEQLGKFVAKDEMLYPEMERSVRLRILHNIRKPLKKFVEVRMPSGKVNSFDVKYEKLPLFCYGCGVLGHGEKECEHGPYQEDELMYGDVLRASPRRREGGWRGRRQ